MLRLASETLSTFIKHKQAEEALKASEEKYRRLVEDINDGYVVIREDGRVVFANRGCAEIFGYTLGEIIGEPFERFLAAERAKEALELRERVVDTGTAPERHETAVVNKEGVSVPVEAGLKLIQHEGKPAVSAIIRDITERKRGEEEIRKARDELEERVKERTGELEEAYDLLSQSEERYRAIVEHAGVGVAVYDVDNNVLLWNEEAERMTGFREEEVVDRKLREIVPDDLLEEARWLLREAKEKGFIESYETERMRKDGTRFPMELTIAALKDDGGDLIGAIAIFKDVTQRKRLEEKLVRSERLAAIGELAATVGHELRNPLGVISNSAYYLNMRLGEADEKVRRHLDILDREVAISNKIISDLLDFSRPKEPTFEEIEINPQIQQALSRSLLPENIEVVCELGEELPHMMADPGQLQQVFLNLISNAAQAMPDGGRLTIRSSADTNEVRMEFSDSGKGIAQEDLERVFEPLFTTRAKGAGLGLTVTRSIIGRHKGTIEVRSQVEKGTSFIVSLPLATGEVKDV